MSEYDNLPELSDEYLMAVYAEARQTPDTPEYHLVLDEMVRRDSHLLNQAMTVH